MNDSLENQDPESNEEIDLAKLESLLMKSEESIRSAADKDIVLVVGKTGSGKSTLINYLHDGIMTSMMDHKTGDLRVFNKIAENEPSRFATIGHSLSETSFPRVYTHENKYDFALCDTAGFGDTRGRIEDLCSYFSLSIAVRSAKRVKAIIVAVDEKAFDTDRGQPFWAVLEIIGKIVSDHQLYQRNVFFVFTKGHRTLKQIKEKLRYHSKSLEESLNDCRCKDAYSMMTLMLKYHYNILKIGPLDKGVSGEELVRAIKNAIPSINRKYLKVVSDQKEHESIKKVIFSLASTFNEAYNIITEGNKYIKDFQLKTNDYKQRIIEIEKKIDIANKEEVTNEGGYNMVQEELKKLEKSKKRIIDDINEKHKNIESFQNKIDKLENDKNQMIIFQESFDEKVKYGTVNKGIINVHLFEYHVDDDCAPICHHKYEGTNAVDEGTNVVDEGDREKFEPLISTKEQFQLRYFTPSHYYGKAKLTLYSEKRFTPENKNQIESHHKALNEVRDNLKQNEDEKIRIEKEINRIKIGVLQEKSNLVTQANNLINQLSKSAEYYERERKICETLTVEWEKKISIARNDLIEKHEKFQMVMRLRNFYAAEVITEFKKNYLNHYPDQADKVKGYSYDENLDGDGEFEFQLHRQADTEGEITDRSSGDPSSYNYNSTDADLVFYHSNSVDNDHMIDLIKLSKLLIGAKNAAEKAAGKDIVLIIGKTGSGKSTLINYLNGGQMRKRQNDSGDIYITNELHNSNFFPKIGHDSSQTLYPAVYYSNDHSYYLCDTAGFWDTRSLEHTIVNEFSLRMVIKAAKLIKSIVIMIDEADIDTDRGNQLKLLLDIISNLFYDSINFKNSVKFVFNKGDRTTEQLKNRIYKTIAQMERTSSQSSSDAAVLLKLLHKYENLMKIDFSSPESKNELLNFFKDSEPIPLERFNLDPQSRCVKEVKDLITKIAGSFLKHKASIFSGNDKLSRLWSELASVKDIIKDNETRLLNFDEADIEKFKEHIDHAIISEKTEKNTLQSRIDSWNLQLREMLDVLNKIQNDESPVLEWRGIFADRRTRYTIVNFVIKTSHTFECELSGDMRISDFKCYERRDGKCYDNGSEEMIGEFSIKSKHNQGIKVYYDCPNKNKGSFGEACLDVYISKRDTLESYHSIGNLKHSIKFLQNCIKEDNNKIINIDGRIKALEQEKEGTISEMTSQFHNIQTSLKTYIEQLKNKESSLERECDECKSMVKKANEYIARQKENYQMVLQLAKFVDKNQLLVEFLEEYSKYSADENHTTQNNVSETANENSSNLHIHTIENDNSEECSSNSHLNKIENGNSNESSSSSHFNIIQDDVEISQSLQNVATQTSTNHQQQYQANALTRNQWYLRFFTSKKLVIIVNITGKTEYFEYIKNGILFNERRDINTGDTLYECKSMLNNDQLNFENNFKYEKCTYPLFVEHFVSKSTTSMPNLSEYSTKMPIKFIFMIEFRKEGLYNHSRDALQHLIKFLSDKRNNIDLMPAIVIACKGSSKDLLVKRFVDIVLQHTNELNNLSLTSRVLPIDICDDGSSRANILRRLLIGNDIIINQFFSQRTRTTQLIELINNNKQHAWVISLIVLLVGWLLTLDYRESNTYAKLIFMLIIGWIANRYFSFESSIFFFENRAISGNNTLMSKIEETFEKKDELVNQVLQSINDNLVKSYQVGDTVEKLLQTVNNLVINMETNINQLSETIKTQMANIGNNAEELVEEFVSMKEELSSSVKNSSQSLQNLLNQASKEVERNGKMSTKLTDQLKKEVEVLSTNCGNLMVGISQAAMDGKFKPSAKINAEANAMKCNIM